MSKKKKPIVELRYYEMPHNEPVLALLGENWIRNYGHDVKNEHFHNLMEVGYCHSGEGELVLNGNNYAFGPDTLCVMPANFPHTTYSKIDTKSFWEYIYFDPEIIVAKLYDSNRVAKDKLIQQINVRPILIDAENASGLGQLVGMIMDEMRQKLPMYRTSVEGLLQSLIVEIARANADSTDDVTHILDKQGDTVVSLIKNAFDYINHHYMDKIKVEDLAAECGLSETHFRRLFIASMNMAPMEYVNLVRIQVACDLMKRTDYSMDEVAQRVGFVTTSTFNRNFKKIVATSPYQWKKNPQNYASGLLNFKISALKGWE